MSNLMRMALGAMERDRIQRSRIVVPEWSNYKDVSAVLSSKLPENDEARSAELEKWAAACGVDVGVIEVIISGDVIMPRIDLLTKIAACIDLPLADLVEPFEGYYTQISTAEYRKIIAWAEGNEHQAMIYTVIQKLTDADGVAVFSLEHKKQLEEAPASVVATIAQSINKRPTLREQVKNS